MTNDKFVAGAMLWTCGLAALAWLLAAGVAAQAADLVTPLAATTSTTLSQGRSAITAHRLLPDKRLPLDGRLSHPTRVRLWFDAQAIYVGVEAIDPEPPLVRHDGVNRTQDFVAVTSTPSAAGSRRSSSASTPPAAWPTACTPTATTARTLHPTSTSMPLLQLNLSFWPPSVAIIRRVAGMPGPCQRQNSKNY